MRASSHRLQENKKPLPFGSGLTCLISGAAGSRTRVQAR